MCRLGSTRGRPGGPRRLRSPGTPFRPGRVWPRPGGSGARPCDPRRSALLYIDGEWVAAGSGATFESRNPATGEVLGEVADGGASDAAAAIEAARNAFADWSKRTAYERSEYLYRAWQIMGERSGELAELMTKEQGKPLRMARNEVKYAADFLLWFA